MNSPIHRDYEKLRALIMRTRFPGFISEVESAFWHVIDNQGITPDQSHFAAAFRLRYPLELDLTDNSNASEPREEERLELDVWAHKVYLHLKRLENAVSSEDVSWFNERLIPVNRDPQKNTALKHLQERIAELENEAKSYQSVDTLEWKRLTTIYRIIIGIAFRKFRFVPGKRNSASENIHTCLPSNLAVGTETIREVLRVACEHLDVTSQVDIDSD